MTGGCLVWYEGGGNGMDHVWRDYVCAFFSFSPSSSSLGPRPEVPRKTYETRAHSKCPPLGSSSGLARPHPHGTGMPCVLCRHLSAWARGGGRTSGACVGRIREACDGVGDAGAEAVAGTGVEGAETGAGAGAGAGTPGGVV